MEITSEKTLIAVRMTISMILCLVITTYFNIIEPTWVYISLFIVLFEQYTIGASLNRSSMRVIATLSSALYSLMIIILFQNDYLMNLIGFTIGIFLYTYLFLGTAQSYIGILGCVTLAICLINYNDFSFVFVRPTNVIIGVLIGLFSLRFFFPSRATKKLLMEINNFLTEYSALSLYLAHWDKTTTNLHHHLEQRENNISALMLRYKTLVNEARSEINKDSSFTQVTEDILQSMRHIFRYYASIIALLLFEQVTINQRSKDNFILLSELMTQLSMQLSDLNHQKPPGDLTKEQESNQHDLLSSMIHLLFLEYDVLNGKINQLIDAAKTIKLS